MLCLGHSDFYFSNMKNVIYDLKKFYNKNAALWSATRTDSFWHEKQFRQFVKYFKKGDVILDIGCAYGIHVPMFLGIGRDLKYEGIDLSPKMIAMAESRYPQLQFRVADITDIKTMSKKKYDGFFAAAVLMHTPLEEWSQMLGVIEQIIIKGGYGYLTLPKNRSSAELKEDKRHFTYMDKKKFRNIVIPRGWKIIRSGKIHFRNANHEWHWFIVQLP